MTDAPRLEASRDPIEAIRATLGSWADDHAALIRECESAGIDMSNAREAERRLREAVAALDQVRQQLAEATMQSNTVSFDSANCEHKRLAYMNTTGGAICVVCRAIFPLGSPEDKRAEADWKRATERRGHSIDSLLAELDGVRQRAEAAEAKHSALTTALTALEKRYRASYDEVPTRRHTLWQVADDLAALTASAGSEGKQQA